MTLAFKVNGQFLDALDKALLVARTIDNLCQGGRLWGCGVEDLHENF